MSLLREIQAGAVNSEIQVSDLLRKCKILAYRLGNEDFKIWLESELNGYSYEDALPSYRILTVGSKGNFVGSFGRSLPNADMPIHGLPDWLKDQCTKATFKQPIATLESYTVNNDGHLSQSWSPAILAEYGSEMYSDLSCIQAWKVISIASVIGIVDTVKTKILNFALEIEVINPKAGEAELNSNPIPQEKVSQIFNFNISGNVQNLASGNNQSSIHQKSNNSQIPEAFINLLNDLKSSEIEEGLVLEVESRIEKLGVSVGTAEYKSLYGELMSFVSNHVTVLGFLVPFIPMLTSYLT
ncbi:hypothetical protein HLH17_08600 [Acinetobacter sp. ANC 5380]|uniref:AbiTii domain-containing protein n=1 Tax=Acinetobacter terrae TaxID=2731247 RepID=A0A7Y2RFK0_9GAMM|nr:hypothetical protein [Acinetobacter terrae]NNH77714.1 hypothetical protein [Acinetobacter terrae]